jgi:hypothetical protein
LARQLAHQLAAEVGTLLRHVETDGRLAWNRLIGRDQFAVGAEQCDQVGTDGAGTEVKLRVAVALPDAFILCVVEILDGARVGEGDAILGVVAVAGETVGCGSAGVLMVPGLFGIFVPLKIGPKRILPPTLDTHFIPR